MFIHVYKIEYKSKCCFPVLIYKGYFEFVLFEYNVPLKWMFWVMKLGTNFVIHWKPLIWLEYGTKIERTIHARARISLIRKKTHNSHCSIW